jgi:hypothetical protein
MVQFFKYHIKFESYYLFRYKMDGLRNTWNWKVCQFPQLYHIKKMWLLTLFDFLETWWKYGLGWPKLNFFFNSSIWALHFMGRVMGKICQKSHFKKKKKNWMFHNLNSFFFFAWNESTYLIQNKIFRWKNKLNLFYFG